MTRVSVLLPNFNNGPFLKEALDSLFNQTLTDFIIYFIDDCSTDNSLEIARSYSDERLKIIAKSENSGIVDTMNVGLDLIDTEYYIRMDGDDISMPNRFEKLVDFMDNNPEIGVCSSSIKTFGVENAIWSFESNPEKNKSNLIFGHSIGHASSIFRTQVIKKNNIRYENLFWRMEDYHLFYKLRDIALTTSIPDQLYLYRRGNYNINSQIQGKKLVEFKKIYSVIIKELGIELNDRWIQMHVQLNRLEVPKFSYEEYKFYIKLLEESNLQKNIYPSKEFKLMLQEKLNYISFKLLDQGNINSYQAILISLGNRRFLRYYLSAILRK